MANELKVVPHEDGLITMVPDPVASRAAAKAQLVRAAYWLLIASLGGVVGGWLGDLMFSYIFILGATAGFSLTAVLALPMVGSSTTMKRVVRVHHSGLTLTPVYGEARLADVKSDALTRKPHIYGRDTPERAIPWSAIDRIVASDVGIDLHLTGGETVFIDLEAFARDDIQSFAGQIIEVWERYRSGIDDTKGTEAQREALAKVAAQRTQQTS